MAWTRSREPVLAKIRLTWVLTVASLTNKARAISRLDAPAAMSRSTSASRGVRSPSPAEPAAWAAPAAGQPGERAAADEQPLLDTGIQHRLAGRGGQHRRPISALVASLVR